MSGRYKDANERIRELEAELARLRTATEARLNYAAVEIESVRRQASSRRAPATVFIGRLSQSEVNAKIRKRDLGNFSDGGNLQLAISRGAKPDSDVIASWLFRWTKTLRHAAPGHPGVYKTESMGLGSARLVSLEDARRKAHHFRELLADGKDPKVERLNILCEEQSAKDCLRTLEQVGEEYIEKKISKRSPGYKQRMRQLLRDNVLNKEYKLTTAGETKTIKVGTLPIQRVTRQIILKDCGFEEFWNNQNPSATGLQQLLDKMYDYARERGYYVGNSPMAWRGGLEHVLPASKDVHTVKHHPELNYKTAPTFLQQYLRKHSYRRSWPRGIAPNGQSINSLMIELALLTGTRVGEIVGAEWQEIDYVTMTWTVPWEHTKRNEPNHPHRMPITRSMLRIFQVMQEMRTDPSPQAPIFPSHHKRWVQSHRRIASQTLLRIVKQLQPDFGEEFVNHGFRSTLKNWCKANGYLESWYEEQVHHKEKGKVKQAYGGDDLLDQRRVMMAAYDGYLNTTPPPAKEAEADNVVKLSKRRTG
jgi:integrase